MKCRKCGAELQENEKICSVCGQEAETVETNARKEETKETSDTADGLTASDQAPSGSPEPEKKKSGKVMLGVAAAVAVVGIGAAAVPKLMENPKKTVIAAFESINSENQITGAEEIFGWKEFLENYGKVDCESVFRIQIDGCSEPGMEMFEGAGLEVRSMADLENWKSRAEMSLDYKHMDLADLQFYYGDQMFMAAVPQLVDRVFTLKIDDSLGESLKNSPMAAPYLEESGVDIDQLAELTKEMMEKPENGKAKGQLDFPGLFDRYRKGCKAKESFQQAMMVEKAEKANFLIDGKETSCKGYHVQINKDSLIAFLRTSSDFFLNDEEMKKQYLDQLRLSISMAALFSGSMENGALSSAEEMVQQNYDEIKEQADWMIQILDQSLQDIDMMVYVDPKGRLAGLTGTTTVVEADMDTVEERREAQIEFALELQGGNYLTENMNGRLSITSDGATMDILYEKAESYDKERLDSSCKVTVLSPDDENITMNASGTYIAESGDCQLSFELLVPEMQPIVIHGSGVVTELEKGKSIYADIDAMSIEAEGVTMNFSGELGYGPLSGEVLPLEGEDLDVLAATEEDWGEIVMEAYGNIFGLMAQLAGVQ
uniref:zinc ribbon domain-containing protein n=1 Tax=Candidatus Ventrimonas sp. TaxID=3048889 RepID=UPI003FEDADF0